MGISINLEFGDGDFEHGFNRSQFIVTIATLDLQSTQIVAQLSPSPEIPRLYQDWKHQYHNLIRQQRGFNNDRPTHISSKSCQKQAKALRRQLHEWLKPLSLELEPILQQYRADEIHLVIHTQKVTSPITKDTLHRLPWQEWDLSSHLSEGNDSINYTGEASLCFNSKKANTVINSKNNKIRRVKIISIFGSSEGINTNQDRYLISNLKRRGAELTYLTEPSRADFIQLWEQDCDILFFAGHSETQSDTQTGVININPRDKLSLAEIKKTLRAAIAKGLKLAIFNSCDGLGLARELADLSLPYIIVWREVVPDVIAQKFIEHFLSSFAEGKSLFASVKEARDKLYELAERESLEKQLSGITWLPIICQTTNEPPPSWSDLGGLTGTLPDNPYRGLAAFREEDAPFYFGREKFIAYLVEAVYNRPLVPVIGASGSGKSSVVFAGLVPFLRKKHSVGIVSFRPDNKPFDNLAVALHGVKTSPPTPLLQGEGRKSKVDNRLAQISLDLDWREDETKLCNYIQAIISASGYGRLVVIADQFEELYTLTPETEQQSFLKALYFAVKYTPNFTLVLTLRADFLGIVLNSLLSKALQEYTPLLLAPMNPEELRDAIEKPAAKMTVELESGLTEKLIDDLGNHHGRLPLLEFALTQLWTQQENFYLTHKAYQEIGGLEKALAKHADEVLDELQLQDLENRYKAEKIFIQLVSPGAGTEDTRRVATRIEVGSQNWDLVQKLADKRLVVTGRDEINKLETVEIVHEALIREWGTFREWIKNNREFRLWQERLKQDARSWEDNQKNPNSLLQGTPLSVAEDWYKQRGEELTPKEQEFIKKSIAQREKQLRQQKFRRNVTIFSLVFGLLLVSFFAGNSEIRRNNSDLLQLSSTSLQIQATQNKNEALVAIIKAAKKLQGNIFSLWAEPETKIKVIDALRSQLDSKATIITHSSQGRAEAVSSMIFSPDGKKIASVNQYGTIELRDVITGEEVKTLKGHTSYVYSVIFSPDGKTIASASRDGTIKLWNVITGKEIKTLKGHIAAPSSVTFSPDGKIIASASPGSGIKLWDVITGKETRTLKGHTKEVSSVIFLPDGKTIASANRDGTIKLWNADTGEEIKTLEGHTDWVYSVIFSPDGKTIASASRDGSIKLWDVITGKEIKTLKGHIEDISSVIFLTDGKTIASASRNGTIKLWNIFTGEEIKTLKGNTEGVSSVIFSPDGKTIASASRNGTIKLWNIFTDEEIKTLKGNTEGVSSVIFSPDGKTIASASRNGTIKLLNIFTSEEIKTLKGHTSWVYSAIFSPDGKTIASASHDSTIKLWDVITGEEIKTLKGDTKAVSRVMFSPDGKTIASASRDGTIKLWDVITGEEIKTLKGHTKEVSSVIFLPDGKTIASASHDSTIKLWNINTGKEIKTLKGYTGDFSSAIFSPDGKTIASVGSGNKFTLRDVITGKEIKTLKGHTREVSSMIFSPDGKTIASTSFDSTVKLWDAATGKEIQTLRRPSSASNLSFSVDGKSIYFTGYDGALRLWDINSQKVSTIAFLQIGSDSVLDVNISQNGEQIASASSQNTIKLWKTGSQETPTTFKGHTAEVLSVSFSPNNQILASASADTTIKLWDVDKGKKRKEIRTLKGHLASVNNVRFSPDDKILASASDDKTVKLWDIKTGTLLKTLEGHENWVNSVSFSPDSKTIASASSDGKVILWNVATGNFIKEYKELISKTNSDPSNKDANKPPVINSVSFSPDGKTLAFATNEQVVKVLDINSNKILFRTTTTHRAKVNSVNFSPDGNTIVSASDSKERDEAKNNLKLWSAATGVEVVTLSGHSQSVNSASFSSDGKTIVSASNDGTYIVWDFDLEDLLTRGCDQLKRDLHNMKDIDRSSLSEQDKQICGS